MAVLFGVGESTLVLFPSANLPKPDERNIEHSVMYWTVDDIDVAYQRWIELEDKIALT